MTYRIQTGTRHLVLSLELCGMQTGFLLSISSENDLKCQQTHKKDQNLYSRERFQYFIPHSGCQSNN